MSPAERVQALAKAKGCAAADITVCILERPRHEEMIAEVRATGAAIRLITDGDVAGVIHCAEAEITGIDMYMGSGGAPEGVLAAAALKCMGGQIYGQLLFRNDDERGRAAKAGITDLDRIYTRDEHGDARRDLRRHRRHRRLDRARHQARAGLADHRDAPDALEDRLGPAHDLPHAGELSAAPAAAVQPHATP